MSQRLSTDSPQLLQGYISSFPALYEFFGDMLSGFMVSAMAHALENFVEHALHVQGPASVNFHHQISPLTAGINRTNTS
jgi:hypothetical protein